VFWFVSSQKNAEQGTHNHVQLSAVACVFLTNVVIGTLKPGNHNTPSGVWADLMRFSLALWLIATTRTLDLLVERWRGRGLFTAGTQRGLARGAATLFTVAALLPFRAPRWEPKQPAESYEDPYKVAKANRESIKRREALAESKITVSAKYVPSGLGGGQCRGVVRNGSSETLTEVVVRLQLLSKSGDVIDVQVVNPIQSHSARLGPGEAKRFREFISDEDVSSCHAVLQEFSIVHE